MKKLFLIVFGFFSTLYAQQPQGFFLDDWQPKTIITPKYIKAAKPDGHAETPVIINAADIITRVPNHIYGNNANVYSTIMIDNPQLIQNINSLNPHVLRYPGGNLSNLFFWNRIPIDCPDDIPAHLEFWAGMDDAHKTMAVYNYYKFLDATHATGLICVNYSYARYGLGKNPVVDAAHLAADWVRYDNGRTRLWEIGNENYGNWQAGYEIDTTMNQDGQPGIISGELYGRHFRVFADSMRAAAAKLGHEIKIGAVAFEAATSWTPIETDWNAGMMPHVGDVADFYAVHSYYTPYNQNSDVETILNSVSGTESYRTVVSNALKTAGFNPRPVALTEWNIFAVGSMQAVSHINGMHAALTLGELIRSGFGLAARWNLANGWDNGNDHGMFSRNGEPDVAEFNPRPAFYSMTYFQKYFGDTMVRATVDGNSDVVAYASTFASGQTGIVLVNKSRQEQTVQLKIENYKYGRRYYWFSMQGGKDNGDFSRQVFINGQGPDGVAGGPSNFAGIPAFSCPVKGNIKITAPALSIQYILVDGKKSVR